MLRRVVRLVLALVFVGLVSLGVYLLTRPTVPLNVRTYGPTWQVTVDGLLQGRPQNASSCWSGGGNLPNLPGFGPVTTYCWTSVAGHPLNFRFIDKTPSSTRELLYMPASGDWTLQHGWCVQQLSGPWWDLRSPGAGCPSKFTLVP